MRLVFVYITSLIASLSNASAQKQTIYLDEIKQTVNRWSEAHNIKDEDEFERLYASKLLFYTKELTRTESIKIKLKRLRESDTFSQRIVSDLDVELYASGKVYCKFVKEVTTGRDVKRYPSYLLLKKYSDKYRIVGESDALTDKRLKYRLDLGEKARLSDYTIIQSSPEATWGNSTITRFLRDPEIAVLMFVAIVGSLILVLYSIRRAVKRKRTEHRENTFLQTKSGYREPQNKSATASLWSWLDEPDSFKRKPRRGIALDEEAVVKQKGNDFEGYIVRKFDQSYFRLIRWQGDIHFNGISPVANTYPDLEYEFHHRDFKKKFAIECKYRSTLFQNQFELEPRKLDNYKKYRDEFKIDVYIVIGLKGLPTEPEELYLLPLTTFNKSNSISYQQLKDYFKSTEHNFFYDKERDELT